MEAAGDSPEPALDFHDSAHQIKMAKEGYRNAGEQEVPTGAEVVVWYSYDLSSHFIPTLLLPLVFPLLLLHLLPAGDADVDGVMSACQQPQHHLYPALIHPSITAAGLRLSPLNFTSISWAIGAVVSMPVMFWVGFYLDYGGGQHLMTAAAVIVGGLVCLLTGLIHSPWPLLPYIVVVAVASTIAAASHSRHLGLLVLGYAGPAVRPLEFHLRQAVSGWLSSLSTAAGCLGAVVVATFTYNMLRRSDPATSLWVVSIFAGLVWLAGVYHAFAFRRPGIPPESGKTVWTHATELVKYPHASFGLVGALFGSFSASCIFAGGLLYIVGELCYKPKLILVIWLTYFATPLLSLPLLHLLNHFLRSDALRLLLLSLLTAASTAGAGFYYRNRTWHPNHVLAATAVQSAATGALHAYGRVLVMDCAPPGKEGVFGAWLSWVRTAGSWAGFAVAAAAPEGVAGSFSAGFFGAVAGVVVLVVGKVSHMGGVAAAGHVKEGRSERGSPARGVDSSEVYVKAEVLEEGRVQPTY